MGPSHHDLREIHSVGRRSQEWIVSADACPALSEAGIRLCGVSLARPGFAFVRHSWEHSQVLLSVGPGGACLGADGWTPLAAGDCYVTPACIPHAYRCLAGRSWLVAWVIFTEPADGGRIVTGAHPRIMHGDGRPLHDAILNLHRETLGPPDVAMSRLWGDLIVAQIRRLLAQARPDRRLSQLWEEVDADLARPWTLSDLARHAGVGGEQLRRLCHRHLGTSPRQQVHRLRMRRAAALLASTERTVGEVAALVGYGNAFAFSTAFRRHHQQPPSQLRNGHRWPPQLPHSPQS